MKISLEEFKYSPRLRCKDGELNALARLQESEKDRILPTLIVMPMSEPRPKARKLKTPEEYLHTVIHGVARSRQTRACIVDFHLVRDLLFVDGRAMDAEDFFAGLRRRNAIGIPSIDHDSCETEVAVLSQISRQQNTPIAVRLLPDVISSFDASDAIVDQIKQNGLSENNIIVILDYGSSTLDDASEFAKILQANIAQVASGGDWAKVIVNATSYPEANKVPKNGELELARNEWLAWVSLELDPSSKKITIFGDYGPDSAKLKFKLGGARKPIPHSRYTLNETYWSVRGSSDEEGSMHEVTKRICADRSRFAGPHFSYGDRQIYLCSRKLIGPGGATNWREWNVSHHLTIVLQNLSSRGNFVLPEKEPWLLPSEQLLLIPEHPG